jgi:hypothetical protein
MGTIRQDVKILQRLGNDPKCILSKRCINVRTIQLFSPTLSPIRYHPFIFNHWLVGFTDGEGTFTIDRQNGGKKWDLVYKISQAKVNGQLIHYIKKNIGIGHITTSNNNVTYRVRNLNQLTNIIFPIFDEWGAANNLYTTKYFDYLLIKEAAQLMHNKNSLASVQGAKPEVFNKKMEIIYEKLMNVRESGIETTHALKLTDDWLLGFWEAKGSFYISNQSEGSQVQYCHGLGISQKKDRRV